MKNAAEQMQVRANAEEVATAVAACLVADLRAILAGGGIAQVVFPTGMTPVRTYEQLAVVHRQALPWSRVHLCQMDEYLGLSPTDPRKFSLFLQKHLVAPLGCQLRPLRGAESDEEMRVYEQEIIQAGGLDLVLYGVGVNGHLGFNEPGSSFSSPSRRVQLHQSTRDHIDTRAGEAPSEAVTLGLAVLNAARRARVIALGSQKRRAIAAGLLHPPSVDMPLSSLQHHHDLRVFVDVAACPA